MKTSHWLAVMGLVAPLLACSAADSGGSGGGGGAGGGVVTGGAAGATGGTGGAVGGTGGGSTGGIGGGDTGGVGGGDTGGIGGGSTGGSSTGGTGGASAACQAGLVEIDNGGQCMCALPCTAGDDAPCAAAMSGSHCCDFSSGGLGFLCGADAQQSCDQLIGTQCGTGGGGGGGLNCDALTNGGAPDCDTCAAASCSSQCNACNANPDCLGMTSCAMPCTDLACIQSCADQYPNGTADFDAFLGQPNGCLISSCQSSCFTG